MSKNERLQALRLMMHVVQDKKPLTHVLQAEHDLTPFTRLLCFGVCRQYYRLELIADTLVDKRPKTLDVWLLLLMGLYQLHFMDKPEYATVQETVALAEKIKKNWAKALVNAVLRRFCRERQAIIGKLSLQPDFVYGHPEWFIRQVKQDWPEHWTKILEGNDRHPPMSLRVNRKHRSRDAYLASLNEHGLTAEAHRYSPDGITLTHPCDVQDLPGFTEGDVSVQDEAAQLAVSLLDLQPGLRLLDACCAPGGKTCHILEQQPELAECVALDVDEQRLHRVRDNLARLGLHARVVQADALHPSTWWDGVPFDRILLDAPCSATGVIRRHPDIKLLRNSDDIQHIASLQAELLTALWPLLRVGGIMVYATCSIMPKENDEQIARFVRRQTDCELVNAQHDWGIATGHGWQILPGEANCDGFFYSLLRKCEPKSL